MKLFSFSKSTPAPIKVTKNGSTKPLKGTKIIFVKPTTVKKPNGLFETRSGGPRKIGRY